MKLKDGRIMHLKAPPRIAGGRIVFTTTDGHTYSLLESDVLSLGLEPTPTPAPRTINPLDSHNLGAIAREQRAETGKKAEVASKITSTPKPTKAPKKTPTPRPAPLPVVMSVMHWPERRAQVRLLRASGKSGRISSAFSRMGIASCRKPSWLSVQPRLFKVSRGSRIELDGGAINERRFTSSRCPRRRPRRRYAS